MIEYPWDYLLAIIGAIGSAATAFALFILWRQSSQTEKQIRLTEEQVIFTRQELESTLRPWLAISEVKRILDFRIRIEFSIKNYGRIPAKVVRSQYLFRVTKITQEQVRSANEFFYNLMIFPDAERMMELGDQISITAPYIGILIIYEYAANKHGEFGLIAKHDPMTNKFLHLEEFSN